MGGVQQDGSRSRVGMRVDLMIFFVAVLPVFAATCGAQLDGLQGYP